MKVFVLTSTGLRHRYLLTRLSEDMNLVGVIQEKKGAYYARQEENSALVQKHFETLSFHEKEVFEPLVRDVSKDNIPIRVIERSKINSDELIAWAEAQKPDCIVLFGTGILNHQWLDRFSGKIINLHLGLSPYYKGSATLFWPFYNNELECLGATIHLAASKVDAGDILAHIKPEIEISDNYYSLNMKIIKKSIDRLPALVTQYIDGELTPMPQQKIGKVYTKSDFTEDTLYSVIEKYKNGIPENIFKALETKSCIC